jgi:succinyl-CoA synthetase beta subunit
MKLHEYQAKDILEHYGVAVQPGIVAYTVDQAVEAAEKMKAENGTELFVVKAQIHAGGRGKGGGVKLARGIDEVREKAGAILGMMLKTHQTGPEGQKVRALLIAEASDIAREYYLGITLDRQKNANVIMASTEGGVEIEKVAEESPDKIIKVWVDPTIGLQPFQTRQIAFGLGLEGPSLKQASKFISALYKAYEETDSSIAEINPLVLTEQGDVIAVDAKINLDANALYLHKDLEALRDVHEEAPLEVEASEFGLNYIKLDGNVGCMVNGAGLAMATMDIIKIRGGSPANFLDVGGGASESQVKEAFRILMGDPKVKAILVNIFGGIMQCDVIAQGIINAVQEISLTVPLVVRLEGTNVEAGKRLLNESGLPLITADSLDDAAVKAVKAATA